MEDANSKLIKKPARLYQFIAAFCCNLGALATGIVMGYSSPSSAMLQSFPKQTNCSLLGNEPLQATQITWFGSILNIGAILGVVTGGYAIKVIGRRGAMIASLLPFILGWAQIDGRFNGRPRGDIRAVDDLHPRVARLSLVQRKGRSSTCKEYNIDPEMLSLKKAVAWAQENKASFRDLGKPHIRRPLIILLTLMAFQQFSGVNAILFNLKVIFESAKMSITSNVASIVVGSAQIAATLVAAGLMDKAGRKILLVLSTGGMAISLGSMGAYFYLPSENNADSFDWLPVASLMVFIFAFNTGFGPIPWILLGELFSPDVKELAGSMAALVSWFASFTTTLIFIPLQQAIHNYGAYWLFSGMCVISCIFTIIFVKETKGKTPEEITMMCCDVDSPWCLKCEVLNNMSSSEPSSLFLNDIEPSAVPQFVTAIGAGLGAFCIGSAIGFSSSAGIDLQFGANSTKCSLPDGEHLNPVQVSWFSSMVGMGAMVGTVLAGISSRLIGPRATMLMTIAPFMIGWSLIGFATSFGMMIAGRLFCGVCVGILSFSVPAYLRDIAHADFRCVIGAGGVRVAVRLQRWVSLVPTVTAHVCFLNRAMEDDENLVKNKQTYLTQYIATACCTFGALTVGSNTSYSSPSTAQLGALANETNYSLIGGEPLSDSQLSWFSSIVNVGAILGVVLGGLGINWIGRRGTMIGCLVPNVLGWALIGLASNFAMLIAGRIFVGVSAGVATIAVPTYIGEIASPDIRGMLGSCFQLMVTVGVLFVYVFGALESWQWLALTCLLPAVVFSVLMVFNKESPSYLLAKDKHEDARMSMQHFRGKECNVDAELTRLQDAVAFARNNRASFRDLGRPHIRRPLLISVVLMVFQQFSGINAILFNLTTIFESAEADMSAENSSILVAVVQVVATAVAAALMDRAGRRPLLIGSSVVLAASQASMGIYFYLLSEDKASNLSWLPITSLMIFIFAFSIGFGPIPWVMMGEIFSADVKELAGSIVAITSWLFSFIITLIFAPLQEAIHDYGVYWLFSGMCVVSFFFSVLMVRETKGKTAEEIAEMFGGTPEKPENNTEVMQIPEQTLHM
ncbi:uncharacterized protein LOC108674318 [Hyalella azteca]|uniref:Uncharacterized protein LOC108674318 n=1 Tax=Hyalella azteca TaxID=294128 RepID=A0A979FU24_HYAAZ|nr:uncharacterized protein LOC108674318 [Hyalella azteca]